jgi:signal peptidase II
MTHENDIDIDKDKDTGTLPSRVLPCLALSFIVIALDQWSKYMIVQAFVYLQSQEIVSFFNLVRVHNTGVAFSFLASDAGWQRWFFPILGISASLVMYRLIYTNKHHALFCWALALIAGGALGNVIDRLIYGYVVDFLDFHWSTWHFAAFNVADSAISLGAALLILDELLKLKHHPKASETKKDTPS